MASKTSSHYTLIARVLAELGNSNPKTYQIRLAESLLFSVYCPQSIIFHKKLSQSERNCLLLAAKGKTIQQTAHLLSIKHSTVTTLRKRTLNKLGCRSMAHAVFIGLYYGCFSKDYQYE